MLVAQSSCDPCDGPSEQPEVEPPLTAGHVYVFGQVDEDRRSAGELADDRRGFPTSNLAREHLDGNVEPENRHDPCSSIFDLCRLFWRKMRI